MEAASGWFDFYFFQCLGFYYRSCHGHLPPLPPSWSLRDFFLTLNQGFVVFIQGLSLNSDFWNGVHSVDESIISSRTRDVDLFTSIARIFLDSPSLPPCSKLLNILYHQIENTNFLHALVASLSSFSPSSSRTMFCAMSFLSWHGLSLCVFV